MPNLSIALPCPNEMRARIWQRALPFAVFILLLALRPSLAGWLGDAGHWAYAVQAGSAALLLCVFWPRFTELHSKTALNASNLSLAILVGVGVFIAWINLDLPFLSLGRADQVVSPPLSGNGRIDIAWLAVRLVGAVIVVPLIEELFWRSLVMRWLEQRDFALLPAAQISIRSVILSSLAFGLEHTLWFAGAVAGISYALLYRRGNLWLAVLAHAVTNLLLGVWVVTTGSWEFW
jgi:uncharacterized protein